MEYLQNPFKTTPNTPKSLYALYLTTKFVICDDETENHGIYHLVIMNCPSCVVVQECRPWCRHALKCPLRHMFDHRNFISSTSLFPRTLPLGSASTAAHVSHMKIYLEWGFSSMLHQDMSPPQASRFFYF